MQSKILEHAQRIDRRQLLRAGVALAAAPLVGCGGGGSGGAAALATSAQDANVVQTTSGQLRGSSQQGVAAWLGIPYAQPPVGALRFRSPQPPTPASGILDCQAFGAASLQTLPPYVTWIYPVPDTQDEDCLTLNVWSPSTSGKLPVIVWLHGGAWRTGATRMPLMNGQGLASEGAVVVSVNFRLGALGGLAHPQLADPVTGAFANWQLQDQIAALQWVHQNIAAFGGDPARICLVGQSAGGTSAALLAQHPVARPLLQRVALLSPAPHGAPSGFSLSDAQAYTELVAAKLGTDVAGLRNVPASILHATELALNAGQLPASFTTGLASKVAPVIDGNVCRAVWLSTPWPTELPVVMTNTLTEGSFFVDAVDPATLTRLTPPLPADSAALSSLVSAMIGARAAPQVITAYTQAAINEGRSSAAGDLWIEIYGDFILRQATVAYAGKNAASGANLRYGTYAHSIKAPGRGVPHCAELPLLFGTYAQDYYKLKVGDGTEETQLSASVSGFLMSFARGEDIAFDGSANWPLFGGVSTPTSALIGAGDGSASTIGYIPKTSQLSVWSQG